jgi:RHS repeat-associated protein
VIEYIVDGMDRRVAKRRNGAIVQRWLYRDRLRIAAELDAAGNLVRRFVYASRANVPDFVIQGANTYRVFPDHLGTPKVAVNVDNPSDIPLVLEHDSFGNVTHGAANAAWLPMGFAGGHFDPETGLVRFGARDYDAYTGRWTARDPILFAGGQSNLYAYVNNDPVNYRDPSGLTVVATDSLAQTALNQLVNTWAGSALVSYLQRSPIEYAVSTNFSTEDGAGQFGNLDGETGNETTVRVAADLSVAELIATLGHELGHAALYNDWRSPWLSGSLPAFLRQYESQPGSPGGLSDKDHIDWDYQSPELFKPWGCK